ncbi:GNAT family N-acetyltransferase [Plantactinospora sp. CA-290183]|uniref:GNAT family N-acetyltransferase n=1 Tax=Plantactinospora sp. CA-290183 TaxID=3240006 RepID=UPI003D90E36B
MCTVGARCDPVMMRELGGPQSRDRVAGQVKHGLDTVRADGAWIRMIIPDGSAQVAGTVTVYPYEGISEIGWMILPEFQCRGLASEAVRAVLDLAQADGRWGLIHAFPSTTNAASNAICCSAGFSLVGQEETAFAGHIFQTNHWVFDPSAHAWPAGSSAA